MDAESVESTEMSDYATFDALSFSWAVDNDIRSSSNLGASSPLHSFASQLDIAIRSSRNSSNWETSSPTYAFASGVDTAVGLCGGLI